ncbi:GHMP kinase [Prochlorococcus sp. MIT 1300]|uniref:GHMP family kinase ATP-binding protein n=1 Tax=Prochlorococcus sp. MIT 1300 TaxID=3096218 RepID=UPI002A756BE9|nr:GHMP kinase [Prochlorococcus sp. MIT 1300]
MLVVTKTPLRISFLGGGTDYKSYFHRKPGAVLGMSIDKYIFIASVDMDGIQDYRYRVSYSKIEQVNSKEQIEHPVIKAVLSERSINENLDISIISDMPANSGLGSSSAFTVGLLRMLNARYEVRATKLDLALEAIYVEKELLNENVGIQDQLHCSFGGINRFDFFQDDIKVSPVVMRGECQSTLLDSLFLVYTGIKRHASQVLDNQIQKTIDGSNDKYLEEMYKMVAEGSEILSNPDPTSLLVDFANLLSKGWHLKKQLSKSISDPQIDQLYERCLSAGALGAKLCGAGAGGFLLCIVPEQNRLNFLSDLADTSVVKISMDTEGSQVMLRG